MQDFYLSLHTYICLCTCEYRNNDCILLQKLNQIANLGCGLNLSQFEILQNEVKQMKKKLEGKPRQNRTTLNLLMKFEVKSFFFV